MVQTVLGILEDNARQRIIVDELFQTINELMARNPYFRDNKISQSIMFSLILIVLTVLGILEDNAQQRIFVDGLFKKINELMENYLI